MAVFKINRSNILDDSFEASDDFGIVEEEGLVKMCGRARRKRVRLDWDSVIVLDKTVEVVVVAVASGGGVGVVVVSSVSSSVEDDNRDDWSR